MLERRLEDWWDIYGRLNIVLTHNDQLAVLVRSCLLSPHLLFCFCSCFALSFSTDLNISDFAFWGNCFSLRLAICIPGRLLPLSPPVRQTTDRIGNRIMFSRWIIIRLGADRLMWCTYTQRESGLISISWQQDLHKQCALVLVNHAPNWEQKIQYTSPRKNPHK